MERVDYYEYIGSPEWRARANAAKARVGYRCQVCNRSRSEVTLDAHHRTYDRLGNELPEDITVLCRDCHELYETQKRLPKPPSRREVNGNLNSMPPITERRTATLSPMDRVYKSTSPSSVPTIYQSEEEQAIPVEGADDDAWNNSDIPRHMLVWLGQFVHLFGYGGNGLLILAIYWGLIFENPVNLISPFTYIIVPLGVISSWLFWQFAVIALLGAGLSIAGIWLVRNVRPRMSMMRWYWRWHPSILLTIPLFLFAWYHGIYALLGLVNVVIRILVGEVAATVALFGANVFRVYLALLPLPILHLVWDNRFRQAWGKFGISIAVLPLLLFAMGVHEFWRVDVMCDAGLLKGADCEFRLSSGFWRSESYEPTAINTLPVAASAPNSISVEKPVQKLTSLPTLTYDAFSALSFCYEYELTGLSKKCSRRRTVFTGTVERLYATWFPSEEYRGATFLKKWYIDGNFIFESESTNEYAYIEVDTRKSLKPGEYLVELYVEGALVAQGNFDIR